MTTKITPGMWVKFSPELMAILERNHSSCPELLAEYRKPKHLVDSLVLPDLCYPNGRAIFLYPTDMHRPFNAYYYIDLEHLLPYEEQTSKNNSCNCSVRDLMNFGHKCGRIAPIDRR